MNQLLLYDLLSTSAGRFPRRVAVSQEDRLLTYGQALEDADRLARVLGGRGIRRGHCVGFWSETTIDAVPLYFALAALGAVFVPLNPAFNADEAGAVLDRVEPVLVITDENHPGDVTLGALSKEQPPSVVPNPEVSELDTHVIFFTSGTTGAPKGCELSQRIDRLRCMGEATISPRGPTVCMFPQFHMAGWAYGQRCWASGEEVVLAKGGDTVSLLEAADRRKAFRLYAIPAVWRRILEADRSSFDFSSLRRADTGTSATPPELLQAIADAFPGTSTSVVYGSTEAGAICQLGPEEVLTKPNSVGPAAPGVHIRIDENGELWAHSPMVFERYYKNPEATAEALVDGWYRTGELAEQDEDGYVRIVGRAKDMIRTGGEWVSPVEVDRVLLSHGAVSDAAVVGIPDNDWGEVIAAFVVLRDGRTIDLDELRQHCDRHLARFKHPRQLHIVQEIPRTRATGQVQRRHLLALRTPVEQP
jgi:acyl-CoA synthetase (AMP-forming)/AMP-acid ligase II